MQLTFISIHTLEEDARILYTSASVQDILGYKPIDIVNRSAWEFFPPEEVPFARDFHKRRVSMDKAAVLAYCRVRNSMGEWVGCECCFTVVYDVIVVCTSVYKSSISSERRALEAPIVRRLFSNSPLDPRYHMLTHLSSKFAASPKDQEHEPRAALFLNRYTRSLAIMYATSGIADIIGISAEPLRGVSFYYMIAINCMPEAVRCLENAKANDSIAYLRFWFRNPLQDAAPLAQDSEMELTTDTSMDSSDDNGHNRYGGSPGARADLRQSGSLDNDTRMDDAEQDLKESSDESTIKADRHEAIFGQDRQTESSVSSLGGSPNGTAGGGDAANGAIELEAVISCTSDGLVVCLRRARPMIPPPLHSRSTPSYKNGLFAAPWARQPIIPGMEERAGGHTGTSFAPSLGPHGARSPPVAQSHNSNATPSPDSTDFMHAIREQAVFAWALTGINGSMSDFAKGTPREGAVPPDGVHIWDNAPHYASPDRADGNHEVPQTPNGAPLNNVHHGPS